LGVRYAVFKLIIEILNEKNIQSPPASFFQEKKISCSEMDGILNINIDQESETKRTELGHIKYSVNRQPDFHQPLIKQQENKPMFNFQDYSLKGQLIKNGRCPKCTLKIPCKHYDNLSNEINVPVSNIPSPISKAQSSGVSYNQKPNYNRFNDVSNRSELVSSETTKDYSSMQRYIDVSKNYDLEASSNPPWSKHIKKPSQLEVYEKMNMASKTQYRGKFARSVKSKMGDSITMRIRGKSNNLQFTQGSLTGKLFSNRWDFLYWQHLFV